jgi:hypothetical protein
VLKDRVLRKIFGPEGEEVTADWREMHMRSFMMCTAYHVLLG